MRPTEEGSGPFQRPPSPFDEAAQSYDAWFDGEGKVIFESELQALRQVLPTLPRPWLEVGAGSGRFAAALGIEAALEPAAGLTRLASGRGVAIALGVGERQPFAAQSFGTAFLITTLCFVDWPLSLLRETHRVLKPEGKLVLGIIPADSPWGRLYEEKKQQGHHLYRQASFLRYSETIRLLERGDLSIERIVSTLTAPPGQVTHVEAPVPGFQPGAGFVVLVAGKVPGWLHDGAIP
jgi:SAM-dependent methyltransferase